LLINGWKTRIPFPIFFGWGFVPYAILRMVMIENQLS
jgi:hypothetical protein